MTEPNPLNPISWLVILLLGFAFFFLVAVPVSSERSASVQVLPADPAGRAAAQSRPPADEARSMLPENGELFAVETATVVVRESAPPQISVTVSGYWPNGCTAEPQIVTAIDGNTVTVAIYRIIPPEVMCTMVLQAAEFDIELTDLLVQDGAVRSGAYSFNVNGVITGMQF
jgi:anti-sigma factor RsiW